MQTLALSLLFTLAGLPRTDPAEDPFLRFSLANGLAAEVWACASAERAAAFVFLPEGFLDDAAGELQWAHLLEHALIRSSEPEGLQKGAISLNGETMGGSTRLEALGPPEELAAMLALLADWLDNRSFGADMIAREAGRIEEELATTTASGHTHKHALAALGQVARHGARELRMLNVLAETDPLRLERLARRRAGALAGMRVVVVGPYALEEVREALEGTLGKLAAEASEPEARSPAGPAQPDLLRVPWDLERSHYLEWYALPSEKTSDRLAHELLARLVLQACYLSPSAVLRGGRALVTIEEVEEGERALLISLGQGEEPLDPEQIRAALRTVLDPFAPDGKAWRDAFRLLPMLMQQLLEVPDLDALRRQWQGRPGAELIEANVALGLVNLELSTGLDFENLRHSAVEVDGPRLQTLGRHLRIEARRGLLLHQRED